MSERDQNTEIERPEWWSPDEPERYEGESLIAWARRVAEQHTEGESTDD